LSLRVKYTGCIHPDRTPRIHDLCKSCYVRERAIIKRREKGINPPIPKKIASCHPDIPYEGLGFCKKCYTQRRDLLKKYNLTLESYDTLLKKQNGHCALCNATSAGGKNQRSMPVDHNHLTGTIRGILCARHNAMTGWVERAIREEFLDKILNYLLRDTL